MKTMLAGCALAVVFLCGCYSQKELQVEMIRAELIRIDTVHRATSIEQQQLTWRDEWNMEYVSFVPMQEKYLVGTRMTMLRNR